MALDILDLPPVTITPRLQRAEGEGRLVVGAREGRSCLERLHQSGAAKIRLPRQHGRDGLEAVLINTGGGLTGGDRMAWSLEAGEGAALTVTTQACEKIYKSSGGEARVETRLGVGAGARLDWLPQETILFDRARIARTLDAEVAPGGRLLALEAVVLGRQAMGETVMSGGFRDRWRIRRGGRLVFADDLRIEGEMAALGARSAVLAGARAFATLLLLDDEPARLLAPLRAALGETGGASAFEGRLVARLVAADGLALRRALLPALAVLRPDAPLPRVWTI